MNYNLRCIGLDTTLRKCSACVSVRIMSLVLESECEWIWIVYMFLFLWVDEKARGHIYLHIVLILGHIVSSIACVTVAREWTWNCYYIHSETKKSYYEPRFCSLLFTCFDVLLQKQRGKKNLWKMIRNYSCVHGMMRGFVSFLSAASILAIQFHNCSLLSRLPSLIIHIENGIPHMYKCTVLLNSLRTLKKCHVIRHFQMAIFWPIFGWFEQILTEMTSTLSDFFKWLPWTLRNFDYLT